MEWMLIVGIVLFALGGILLIFGFARLIWWGVTSRETPRPSKPTSGPQFPAAYYRDPWLRAPSMASVISRHKDVDVDSLHVDTDDIYALPADAKPHGMYLHPSPPTEHELSQTESQIYADSTRDTTPDGIYSVPAKVSRDPDGNVLDEGDSAPAVPHRYYRDGDQTFDTDRRDTREITYVDPPVDYSPERRVPHLGAATYHHNGAVTTATSTHGSNSKAKDPSDNAVYKTTVFTEHYGDDVKLGTGSMKSLKSLYKYMYTEEPCALDKEMDITFMTVH